MSVNTYIEYMWSGIHMMCKTYGYNKDIKYLECFIFSLFVLLPEACSVYTDAAKKWIDSNGVSRLHPKKYATDEPNSSLFSWSIDLHLYLDKQYKLVNESTRLTSDILVEKYAVSKLFKDVWGPVLWKVIHTAPLIIDSTDTKLKTHAYKAMVSCLQIVLPCPVCRVHFKTNLPKIPIDDYIYNAKALFIWSVSMHNEVNTSLKKKEYSVSDALALYKVPS